MSKMTYTVASAKFSRQVVGTKDAFLAALADDDQYQPIFGTHVIDANGDVIFSTDDVIDKIAELREGALLAGDDACAELCDLANGGDRQALERVVAVMADAAAMQD